MRKLFAWFGRKYSENRDIVKISLIALAANLAYGVLNLSAIPPYVKARHWASRIGLFYAVFMLCETALRSPVGSLSDYVGRRPVYIAGAIIGTGAAFLWTVLPALWMIMIVRGFEGAMFAAFYTVTVVAMGGALPREKRTQSMIVFIVVLMAGMSIGPAIGGFANDATGSLKTSFYMASSLFLLAAILAYFLLPSVMREQEENGNGQKRAESEPFLSEMWEGIRTTHVYILTAFVMYLPIGLIIPIVKLFAMAELGLSETNYGVLFLSGAVAVGILSLATWRLTGAWGKARSVQVGLAIASGSMFGVALIHMMWWTIISAGGAGVGFILLLPAWLALISDMAPPEKRGSVVGAVGLGQGLGMITGVILGGYFYHSVPFDVFGLHLKSHYTPFLASAIGLGVAFVLSLSFVRDEDTRE